MAGSLQLYRCDPGHHWNEDLSNDLKGERFTGFLDGIGILCGKPEIGCGKHVGIQI